MREPVVGDLPTGAPAHHRSLAAPIERAVAGIIGAVIATAGVFAVFQTDNELGSGALLLAGAAFLTMATFGLVPTRFKVGGNEMEVVGRAALQTLDKVIREADPVTQEAVIDAFEGELAEQGIKREPSDAVQTMLRRFERYSGSQNPRTVYEALLATGWQPLIPGKSTYIRWVYSGNMRSVSLLQNSGTLVASTIQLRDFARTLTGASEGPKSEAVFAYAGDPAAAIDAADEIRRFANADH